jgi:hypothetical protein
MKDYLKSVLIIVLLGTCLHINAQVKPGYIFGINLSSIKLNTKSISSNPERPVGLHFGCVFEIPVKGKFKLDPAILLSAKGSNYKIDSVEYSLSPIYVEVPFLALYSFGSDEIKISFFAGPYFACGVGGYKIMPGGELQDINYGSGDNKDLKSLDFGLNFGAGIFFRGLLISARYGIGLTNIAPESSTDLEMKNNVIGISISSLFARK